MTSKEALEELIENAKEISELELIILNIIKQYLEELEHRIEKSEIELVKVIPYDFEVLDKLLKEDEKND